MGILSARSTAAKQIEVAAILEIVAIGCSDGYEPISGADAKLSINQNISVGPGGKISRKIKIAGLSINGHELDATQDNDGSDDSFFIQTSKYDKLKIKLEGEGMSSVPILIATKEQQARFKQELK